MSSTRSFAPERFHRHAFVWFSPGACDRDASPEHAALLRDWLAAGRPLIVRRAADVPPSLLPVGLALPPRPDGKPRIPFLLLRTDVRDVAPPPPAPLQGGIFMRLAAAARQAGTDLRCFGSHAWQFLTGLSYVTPESDADLLIFLESREQWDRLRAALEGLSLPPEIDLEIVLRRDAAFSWREYARSGRRLLFKGGTHVWLGEKTDIAQLLQAGEKEALPC